MKAKFLHAFTSGIAIIALVSATACSGNSPKSLISSYEAIGQQTLDAEKAGNSAKAATLMAKLDGISGKLSAAKLTDEQKKNYGDAAITFLIGEYKIFGQQSLEAEKTGESAKAAALSAKLDDVSGKLSAAKLTDEQEKDYREYSVNYLISEYKILGQQIVDATKANDTAKVTDLETKIMSLTQQIAMQTLTEAQQKDLFDFSAKLAADFSALRSPATKK